MSHLADTVRWGLAAMIVLGMHAAIAATALLAPPEPFVEPDLSGAMVVELSPLPVARADLPKDIPAGPDQVQGAATPEVREAPKVDEPRDEPKQEAPVETAKLDLPAIPEPEAPLPPARVEPRPIEVALQPPSQPQSAAAATSAVQVESEATAPVAAASVLGGTAKFDPRAVATWHNKLSAALERQKRYPAASQARREEGVVDVSFVMDRQGRLLSSRITRSSKYSELDAEALELLARAQPFPIPPQDFGGSEIALRVPIRFNFR